MVPWPSRKTSGHAHTHTYLPPFQELRAGTTWTPHGEWGGGTLLPCGRHSPTPRACHTHAVATNVVVDTIGVAWTSDDGAGTTTSETAAAGPLYWLGPDACAGRPPRDVDDVGNSSGLWSAPRLGGTLVMTSEMDAVAGDPSVVPAFVPPPTSMHPPAARPAALIAPPILITTANLLTANGRRAEPLVVDEGRRMIRRQRQRRLVLLLPPIMMLAAARDAAALIPPAATVGRPPSWGVCRLTNMTCGQPARRLRGVAAVACAESPRPGISGATRPAHSMRAVPHQ